jgi:GTP-binding protein Era
MNPQTTHAGFVALIGRPNVGKSTLLNRLVGVHLAAVSPKAQTTRHRISGFRVEANTQIVFVDTPGLLEPGYALQTAMVESARAAIEGVDAIYWLVDGDEVSEPERKLLTSLQNEPAPVFLVLTKSDRAPRDVLDRRTSAWAPAFSWAGCYSVSATTGEGVGELLTATRQLLPEQPFFYPEEDLTDLSLRFLGGELIREACYRELGAELPYSVHAVVTDWTEPSDDGRKTALAATLYVERESQKGMVIGQGGKKVKAIGIRARRAIEALIGGPVHLSLQVKVRKKWSRREADLKFFGYKP